MGGSMGEKSGRMRALGCDKLHRVMSNLRQCTCTIWADVLWGECYKLASGCMATPWPLTGLKYSCRASKKASILCCEINRLSPGLARVPRAGSSLRSHYSNSPFGHCWHFPLQAAPPACHRTLPQPIAAILRKKQPAAHTVLYVSLVKTATRRRPGVPSALCPNSTTTKQIILSAECTKK